MTTDQTRPTPAGTPPPGHHGRRARVVTTGLAALLLAGCSLLDPELLPAGTEEVTIEVGETTQVDLGWWSPGVGDDWGVLPPGDDGTVGAQVVTGGSVFGERERRDDGTGGESPYAVELTGLAPGTSTVLVAYCYRTAITEGCDQGPNEQDTIELTVTVT